MKGYLSVYVDLKELNLSGEDLHKFDVWLHTKTDQVYEDMRLALGLGPADFARKTKAEHGIKDGRDTVEIKEPKPKRVKKTPPDASIPPGELGDDPPLEAPGT